MFTGFYCPMEDAHEKLEDTRVRIRLTVESFDRMMKEIYPVSRISDLAQYKATIDDLIEQLATPRVWVHISEQAQQAAALDRLAYIPAKVQERVHSHNLEWTGL